LGFFNNGDSFNLYFKWVYFFLFGKKGLEWLGNLELYQPHNKPLKNLLETYEVICQKVSETDWLIREVMATDRDCQLLLTIPGRGFSGCVGKGRDRGYRKISDIFTSL